MRTVGEVLVALVALEHVYIMVLEMLLWTTPRGRATFGTTVEQAEQSKVLAQNQGLYNGFLAAGLGWSLVTTAAAAYQFKLVFLICVVVAALFGGATVSRRIVFVQGGPAVLALVAVLIGGR